MLAAACDRRVANAGHGRIGVTELLVGVPFPLVALEILRYSFGNDRLAGLIFLGQTYPGEEASRLGLVDELVDPQEVLPRAIEVATLLADIPSRTFAHTKTQLHQPAQSGKAALQTP